MKYFVHIEFFLQWGHRKLKLAVGRRAREWGWDVLGGHNLLGAWELAEAGGELAPLLPQNVINNLEYSNKKRVQQLSSELQEWEEMEESKMNNLNWQVEQLNAEIQKIQEEVNFLSTYMDHEYPVRSVQIANHMSQVQQAKDCQQDELDSLNKMCQVVLESLSNTVQEKK
ncbi:uncharacterized protein C20orf96-like, partial [Nannospalax galili]|uniref:uncharacterized protein C20orf96-like n=1 Tax=Nannospalax galili TaxID=1026970 RepID=UPI0004ED1D18